MLLKGKWSILAVIVVLLVSLTGALVLAQDAAQDAAEPLMLQDFEGEVTLEDVYQAKASVDGASQNGSGALASISTEGDWHTVGASFINAPVDVSGYGELCFGMNDTTAAGNTVGVKLFDASGASAEKWTDHEGVGVNPKTISNEWVTMCLNLDTYTDIDLTALTKIEFAMFAAGTYYFDDILVQAATEDPVATEEPVSEEPQELTLTVIQGFETEDSMYAHFQSEVSVGEVTFSGEGSLMAVGPEGEWHSFGGYPDPRPFDASGYDVLCFMFYDTTANNDGKADNTVGVRLFDGRAIDQEVWTDHVGAGDNPKTVTNEWVQMCINLSSYGNLDLTQLDKVEFSMYHPGTYYVDDLAVGTYGPALKTGTLAQGFETEASMYAHFQSEVSVGDVAFSGEGSLMAVGPEGEWHSFGGYPDPRPFDASGYEQMCFMFYDTTANNDGKADNTVGVRLFDGRAIDQEVWTDHVGAGDNPKTITNEWVQMCINLASYGNLDLTQLDKVEFSMYHPGTYYVDDLTFVPAADAE